MGVEAGRTADYKLNEAILRVTYGDIVHSNADAIVSSDDNYLSMGGGISRSLLKTGGDIIAKEARKHLPLSLGDVVATSAGQLSAKYIFHAVTINYDSMEFATKESIEKVTDKCLRLADALKVRKIAFPALGTGVAKFPFQLAAEIMTRTIAEYLLGETQIESVIITLYPRECVGEDDLNLFYEQSVGLASLYAHSKKLNVLLSELSGIVGQMGNPTLVERLNELREEMLRAQETLEVSPNHLDDFNHIRTRSGIAKVSEKIVIESSQMKKVIAWENDQLEAAILRTQLNGLLTRVNIHTVNLNHCMAQKAKHGSDVPTHLMWEIEENKKAINDLEEDIRKVRAQLTKVCV